MPPEINHGEPTSQTLVEMHLGSDYLTTRGELISMVGAMRDIRLSEDIVDAVLDKLILKARPVSALASLFLKRVKEGRA